jgi:hypothetical protein
VVHRALRLAYFAAVMEVAKMEIAAVALERQLLKGIHKPNRPVFSRKYPSLLGRDLLEL